MKRLLWLDVAKGLTILVGVYFNFFLTYFEHEVILSERSLVVFFHAHPVLSNLSAALLGSEKTRAMDLFANRVCHRIFRALSNASFYPQNGMWILGGFAICRLPEF